MIQNVKSMRENPFKLMMAGIGQSMNTFFYHKREEVILQIFWRKYSLQHDQLDVDQRKRLVIRMIERAADKEIIP